MLKIYRDNKEPVEIDGNSVDFAFGMGKYIQVSFTPNKEQLCIRKAGFPMGDQIVIQPHASNQIFIK